MFKLHQKKNCFPLVTNKQPETQQRDKTTEFFFFLTCFLVDGEDAQTGAFMDVVPDDSISAQVFI